MSEYQSPQDKLNNIINTPPAPEAAHTVDARTNIAMNVFAGTLTVLAGSKKMISQEEIKEMAVMSVDAADILIAQLAKRGR